MATDYKDKNSAVGLWLRHFFGLTYLKPVEVGDCIVEDFMSEKPVDNRVDNFLDYLIENYVDDDAVFPPEIWAAQDSSLARTTNACESFHSKFNSELPNPHPNIYVFLRTLKDMQTDTYFKINATKRNEIKLMRKEILKKQKFVTEKIDQLEKGLISRYNYVKCVSYRFSSLNV